MPSRPDMVCIPGGWFSMGSDGRYYWESPLHRVWVDDFQMARKTVTREEYQAFLIDTGNPEPLGWSEPCFSLATLPVVGVNWFDAVAYCRWLSDFLSEPFRLPTEAEWEKACRGGVEGAEYSWGNEQPSMFPYFGGEWNGPKEAGNGPPNGYGLLNIGDNVHEWCSDWYSETYYGNSPDRNPFGPDEGSRRVSRGGSWRHQVKASRAAHRSSLPPDYRYTDYGFRLATGMHVTNTEALDNVEASASQDDRAR